MTTYHLLPAAQHSQLPEADVEGRALELAILLLHHDNIDGSRQGGRIDVVVEVTEVAEDTRQAVHLWSGLGWSSLSE